MTPTLPKPPREVPVNSSRGGLAPAFDARLELVLEDMRAEGHDPLVFETIRTAERQRFLWGFGREYDDGRGVVTHSPNASFNWHHYGLAADIICRRREWKATAEFWQSLARACKRRGLRWGNDWDDDGIPVERDPDERFSDRPHVQWLHMRRTPSENAVRLAKMGGCPAIWREVGADVVRRAA